MRKAILIHIPNLKNIEGMKIELYKPEYKVVWDEFVSSSKNGTFLFYRDFMEYHQDRFNDYSLMFYINDILVAMMPGHIEDKVYYSHKGLTYGGLIMSEKTTAVDVLKIFEHLTVTFRHQGIKKIVYKAIPHIYHNMPAEEDLYALFRYKAILSARSISSSIYLSDKPRYSELRRRSLKKAEKNGLVVQESSDFALFWQILSQNLEERHNVQPVHSLTEIVYLKEKFPDNIHLYLVSDSNQTLGGCVVFETEKVSHIQYIAATADGKSLGAVDIVIDYIINIAYPHKIYFDYGTSTEQGGMFLNEGLISQKEGFGARAIVYDIYTIDL